MALRGASGNAGTPCLRVITEYGPKFTLTDLAVGFYTVMDGETKVGEFRVNEATHSIKGRVTDDPYPSRRLPKPLEGVRVFLKKPSAITVLDNNEPTSISAPYIPYVKIDSTITLADGTFGFSDIPEGNYRLGFIAEDYHTKSKDINLVSDTFVEVKLLSTDARASVTGTVTAIMCDDYLNSFGCEVKALPGCTVTVMFSDCSMLYKRASRIAPPELFIRCLSKIAVTDNNGNYTIEDIPIPKNHQPIVVTARKKGYAVETKSAELNNMTTTRVDFQLAEVYSNEEEKIIDGIRFAVATEKTSYSQNETIRIRYTVENKSMATVTYNFSNSCKYDMMIHNDSGDEIYHYLDNIDCLAIPTQIELGPGESESFYFTYYVTAETEHLLISGLMAGYEKSKVSVTVPITTQTPVIQKVQKTTTADKRLTYSNRTGKLILNLNKGQHVTIDAFTLSGKKIRSLSHNGFFKAGHHTIFDNTTQKANGMIIVWVRGEDFQTTRKINSHLTNR